MIAQGEWAIVGFADAEVHSALAAFGHDAHVELMAFSRDYNEIEGLFVPVMLVASHEGNGPFTADQARRRDDWSKFEAATELELDKIEENDTWELVDWDDAISKGAYVYPTRWVLTISRNGTHKARLVLRGDHQVFDDDDDGMQDWSYDDDDDEHDDHERNAQQANANMAQMDVEIDANDGEVDVNEVLYGKKEDPFSDFPESDLFAGLASLNDDIETQFSDVFEALSYKAKNVHRQLFSPVMQSVVMLIILSVAVQNGESLFIADVKGAFLYALLLPDEVVYCRPPKGWENHPRFQGKIMRLRKALYGLRQAPRRWWEHLVSVLAKHGLKKTRIDPSFFVRPTDENGLLIKAGTHVDDFLFSVNNKAQFERWIGAVKEELNMSKYEPIATSGSDYMSIEMSYDTAAKLLKLSQRAYIEKSLSRFNLTKAKSADTPFATGVKVTQADMPTEVDLRRMETVRAMLGCGNWIARLTCPEAVYAISYWSQFMSNPSASVLRGVVRVFRYYKWTIENDVEGVCVSPLGGARMQSKSKASLLWHGNRLQPNTAFGYIDATFLSEEMSESRYGIAVFVNSMAVYVKTGKLPKIVLSSTEAEYVALVLGAIVFIYIRMVLEAMGEAQDGPILIGQDNSACIQIAENPGRHIGRTKHMDVRIRWIEEAIDREIIALVKVPSSKMVADVLTKALTYAKHACHASVLKGQQFPGLSGDSHDS